LKEQNPKRVIEPNPDVQGVWLAAHRLACAAMPILKDRSIVYVLGMQKNFQNTIHQTRGEVVPPKLHLQRRLPSRFFEEMEEQFSQSC